MDDNKAIDDRGPLCRLCAHTQSSDNLVYIFSDKDENHDNLADFINLNLPIKVCSVTSVFVWLLLFLFIVATGI